MERVFEHRINRGDQRLHRVVEEMREAQGPEHAENRRGSAGNIRPHSSGDWWTDFRSFDAWLHEKRPALNARGTSLARIAAKATASLAHERNLPKTRCQWLHPCWFSERTRARGDVLGIPDDFSPHVPLLRD